MGRENMPRAELEKVIDYCAKQSAFEKSGVIGWTYELDDNQKVSLVVIDESVTIVDASLFEEIKEKAIRYDDLMGNPIQFTEEDLK